MTFIPHVIDGQESESASGARFASVDPWTRGDPKDEATQLGPLASEQHYRKVRSYLDGIEADGGTIRTGGLGDGWVVLSTVVENARRPRASAARRCSARS